MSPYDKLTEILSNAGKYYGSEINYCNEKVKRLKGENTIKRDQWIERLSKLQKGFLREQAILLRLQTAVLQEDPPQKVLEMIDQYLQISRHLINGDRTVEWKDFFTMNDS